MILSCFEMSERFFGPLFLTFHPLFGGERRRVKRAVPSHRVFKKAIGLSGERSKKKGQKKGLSKWIKNDPQLVFPFFDQKIRHLKSGNPQKMYTLVIAYPPPGNGYATSDKRLFGAGFLVLCGCVLPLWSNMSPKLNLSRKRRLCNIKNEFV
jgi:hypothetical protein